MFVLPLAVLLPLSVPAQVTVTLDATGATAYVWRGVTLTNRFVLQPDATVAIALGKQSGVLTFGAWTTFDLGKYDASDEISEGGGRTGFGDTEIDLWAEYGRAFGKVNATVGGLQYLFPNGAGLTNDINRTFEIYGKVQAPSVFLAPKLAVWYDVDKVQGAYAEGSVSKTFNLATVPLTMGILAGFSMGQGINDEDPTQVANFAGNGLTAVDLSAAIGLKAGPIVVTPAVHVLYAHDDFTKITAPGVTHDFKAWAGVTLTWSTVFAPPPPAE